jgi:hypothetical protein
VAKSKKKQKDQTQVERRIRFFRVYNGEDVNQEPLDFDYVSALRNVEGLGWPGRYVDTEDAETVGIWLDKGDAAAGRGEFARTRRNGLPKEDVTGSRSPLPIHPGGGLNEATQFVFFPGRIVGAITNRYGPPATRLSYYLTRRGGRDADGNDVCSPDMKIRELLSHEAEKRLGELNSANLVSLKIHPSFAKSIGRASRSLGSAFDAAGSVGDAEVVEISLRIRRRKGEMPQGLLDLARRIVRLPGLSQHALRAVVQGVRADSGKADEVDLLGDSFVRTCMLPLEAPPSGAVISTSAYSAIVAAHDELREALEIAADYETT